MRRREFATMLAASAAWPLAAVAQPAGRVRRIGVLMGAAADEAESQARIGAFAQGLADFGWHEGRNLRMDVRWASTSADDIRRHAGELAALAPDVILSGTGTATIGPLLQATRTLPIVFKTDADLDAIMNHLKEKVTGNILVANVRYCNFRGGGKLAFAAGLLG